MSNSFLDGTGRGRRAAVYLIAALSVFALVAAVAALLLVNRSHNTDTASTTPKPNATANVPTGPLTQIKGERTVEGVSVGYPHTTAGAVSAAAEYTAQIGSTLDYDRARVIIGIIADPSFATAEDEAIAGRKNSRKSLGVADSGPVPDGVSMTVGPAAFQLRSVTADQMTVLLLSYLTTIDAKGTITPRVIVQPAEMRWSGGDWKLLPGGAAASADFSALVAQPGTPDAAAKGWKVITP